DWSARAEAAQELARAAHRPDIAEILLTLLLDQHDTAVTDATCHALLNRGDIHGVRLIARAIPAADPEQHDHIYGVLGRDLLPSGPVVRFNQLCAEVSRDPDPTASSGAETLITWTGHWESAPE